MKFDFWKHNRTDQHYQLTDTDLCKRFKGWMEDTDDFYLMMRSYSFSRTFGQFLSSLNSSCEPDQVPLMENYVYEAVSTGEFWGKVKNAR